MDLSLFERPYEFIPPYRGKIWSRLLRVTVRPRLRKEFDLHEFEFRGTERLRASLSQGAGILLVPNHCRYSDPPVVGAMGLSIGEYFYYAASWHLFLKSRYDRWALPRVGAFSVYREGADREMVREAAQILTKAERPIVLFPEGTFYRQNDRLGPFQDGVSFIARRAVSKGARPQVLHPIAIKYWFLGDPQPAIQKRLDALEKLFLFYPTAGKSHIERLLRIISAIVALREIEYIGSPQEGLLAERIGHLQLQILKELEMRAFGSVKSGSLMERLRIVRQLVVRQLRKSPPVGEARTLAQRMLHDLAVCQQLFSHDVGYLTEHPSSERIAETIQRIEEDTTGSEKPLAPMGVVVEVLPALMVKDYLAPGRGECDALSHRLAADIQGAINEMIRTGPPAHWRQARVSGSINGYGIPFPSIASDSSTTLGPAAAGTDPFPSRKEDGAAEQFSKNR